MFVIVICTIVEGLGNCSGINRAIKLSYRSINSSAYMLGKVVRSAAGSIMRMPVADNLEPEEAADLCRQAGKKIAVSCLEDAESYMEADLGADTAIVIGNEGRGVSEEFMKLADVKVKIPMKGEIESLNAAVAAGILMFAAAGKVK